MTTSAPSVRIVDALSGCKGPDKFWQALTDTDFVLAQIGRLTRDVVELQARLDRLEGR